MQIRGNTYIKYFSTDLSSATAADLETRSTRYNHEQLFVIR